MKLSVVILFILIKNSFAEECQTPSSLTEIEKLAEITKGNSCDPLEKSTWDKSWKSPCECIKQKDPYTRLKSANTQFEQSNALESVAKETEIWVAEAIRNQFMSQIEQSMRLDVYLKKSIISTTNNLNKLNIDSSVKVSIPSSCYLNNIGNLLEKIDQKSKNNCNQETFNRRSSLLFGQKGFEGWKEDQLKMLEKITLNQLDESDSKKGLCIPYKSYLSLTNSNPLRATYLRVASVMKKDFSGFQKWAQDRSNPDDSATIITEENLKNKGLIETAKFPSKRLELGTRGGFGLFDNAKISINSEFEKKDLTNVIESISKDDIARLIKTDPIFERMIRDEQFYKQILSQPNPETISENDPRIIKLISESQNRSCETLYGFKDSSQTAPTTQDTQPGRGRGRGKQVSSPGPEASQPQNSLLFEFLCSEESPKQYINENYIKTMISPQINRQLRLKSNTDSELLVTDYLYCSGERPVTFVAGDTWKAEFNSITGKEFPLQNPTLNLLNPILNPQSDIRGLNDFSMRGSTYKSFNNRVCNYVPEECKNNKSLKSDKCEISNFSKDIAENLIKSKLSDLNDDLKNKLILSLEDLSVNDKTLRANLLSSSQFKADDINAILLLRQQMPKIIKAKAESELRVILGIDKSIQLDDAFYQSRGGIDKLFESNPSLTIDLKNRILGNTKNQTKSLVAEENIEDEESSYFSNYFALGDSKDEGIVKKGLSTRGLQTQVGRSSASQLVSSNGGDTGTSASQTLTTPDSNENQDHYVRKAFRPKEKYEINPPKAIIAEKPEEKKDSSSDKKEEAPQVQDSTKEKTKSKTAIASNDIATPLLTISTDSNTAISKSNKSMDKGKKTNEQDEIAEEQLDDVQNRIDDLNSMADMIKKIKADMASKSTKTIANNSANSDDKAYRDEVKRLQDEENRLSQKERGISDRERQIRNRGFSGSGTSGSTSLAEQDSPGYVDPYDPLARGATGRREITDEASNSGSGGVAKSKKDSAKLAGSAGAAIEAEGDALTGGVLKKSKRFPASENGESDPDDLCGYEQELECYFEYASIDVLSPSLARFVEYLELQGRSFKAVEIYKYKNNAKPTRYFIHYYEPMENMTKEDKDALYARTKELLKDYKKNKKELKTIASQVVEVKKAEVTKDEVKELSKSILRVPDLNKLSERRARK